MTGPHDPMAATFRDAARAARVPSSGLMWWRIQLRAKREAEAEAVRAVSRIQGIVPALAVAFGLVVLVAGGWRPIVNVPWGAPLLLASIAGAVLMPVVVWLALARD